MILFEKRSFAGVRDRFLVLKRAVVDLEMKKSKKYQRQMWKTEYL
jgi:hypothetical protein